ncbi:hypothetical protein [Bordetella genomosp. 13]|uniref:hypothetical protein n=1 Tax=Bordetella genomosp. 13 TaxID=463040 RepID=UPI0011A0ED84|nr:hypothetical protein [Bordetella genomosp. 13]
MESFKAGEILIVVSSFGGIQGAHVRPAAIATDPFNPGTQTQVLGPARPIFDSPTLQSVLGEATTVALAENSTLQADLTTAKVSLEFAQSDLAAAQAEADTLRQQVASRDSNIAQLQAELDALRATPEQVAVEEAS